MSQRKNWKSLPRTDILIYVIMLSTLGICVMYDSNRFLTTIASVIHSRRSLDTPAQIEVSPPPAPPRVYLPVKPEKKKTSIAICALSKSKPSWKYVHDSCVYKLFLKGIYQTTSMQTEYNIGVHIGVDTDDAFWSKKDNYEALILASARDFNLKLNVHHYVKKQPNHLPMNELMRDAARTGAEYLVRLNDDTEIKSMSWLPLSVRRLSTYDPPFVGVVGPVCREGKTSILTHDMVHRTHLEIFDTYYPPNFHNWYVDDWISAVYGPERTTKIPDWVVHHYVSPPRYNPIMVSNETLQASIRDGRERIQAYLSRRNVSRKLSQMSALATKDQYTDQKTADIKVVILSNKHTCHRTLVFLSSLYFHFGNSDILDVVNVYDDDCVIQSNSLNLKIVNVHANTMLTSINRILSPQGVHLETTHYSGSILFAKLGILLNFPDYTYFDSDTIFISDEMRHILKGNQNILQRIQPRLKELSTYYVSSVFRLSLDSDFHSFLSGIGTILESKCYAPQCIRHNGKYFKLSDGDQYIINLFVIVTKVPIHVQAFQVGVIGTTLVNEYRNLNEMGVLHFYQSKYNIVDGNTGDNYIANRYWQKYQRLYSNVFFIHPLSAFKTRSDLGVILDKMDLKIGVELGVQKGIFASQTLEKWKSVKSYHLIDLWKPQKNYKDIANNMDHDQNYRETLSRMKPFEKRGVQIKVCRNLTSVCVHEYPNEFFDYVYVDARHDFKGVYMDLNQWWPKLKPGGVFAGHDYVTQIEGPKQSGQDWTVNFDGTIDETGTVVKGAVNKFVKEHQLVLWIGNGESWPSWAILKPSTHSLSPSLFKDRPTSPATASRSTRGGL